MGNILSRLLSPIAPEPSMESVWSQLSHDDESTPIGSIPTTPDFPPLERTKAFNFKSLE